MTENSPKLKLNYQNTRFLTSASTFKQCPADTAFEVAFAGRSNAGKSSAINVLCCQAKLARTSKTPGRTQLINFFQIADDKYIVDLPGYGYAKVPMKVKIKWQKQLELYLQQRQSLKGLVLLMDIRRPFQAFDTQMVEWAVNSSLPIHILLTKADKFKSGAAKNALLQARKHIAQQQTDGLKDLATMQLFSSLKKTGVEELKKKLNQWLIEV